MTLCVEQNRTDTRQREKDRERERDRQTQTQEQKERESCRYTHTHTHSHTRTLSLSNHDSYLHMDGGSSALNCNLQPKFGSDWFSHFLVENIIFVSRTKKLLEK